MTLQRLWLAAAVAVAPSASLHAQHVVPEISIVIGVDSSGLASEPWLAILRKRLAPAAYDSVAPMRRRLTHEDSAWIALIREHASAWPRLATPLAALYRPAVAPPRVRIVLGNRGADDAFTHDEHTIGFDLAALQANYGDARQPANADRMDRFFRHEFTHLLQKSWMRRHPWTDRSSLGRALADMWAEGLGNYYSLSDRWVDGGKLTPEADSTLARLEPELVDHIAALSCADSAAATPHLATLSSGPFARKWGALPVALWLAADDHGSGRALRALIVAGPDGIWDLASRHLPPPLARRTRRARAAARRCARPPAPRSTKEPNG